VSFIRAKEIPPGSGNWYDYEVENHREGDKVIQKHIRYIGRAGSSGGGLGTTSRSSPTQSISTSLTIVPHVEPKPNLSLVTTHNQPNTNEITRSFPEPKPVLGTTGKPQLGEYRYSVDGRILRRGVVVNESWIGEGPNAVKWDGGGVNSNMGMTLEEAQAKLDTINSGYQNRQRQQADQYQSQSSKLESAMILSPKSKILQSFKSQLSPRKLLSSSQMAVVNKIINKTPYKPIQLGTTREVFKNGEKVTEFYTKSGWVEASEMHEVYPDLH